MPFDDEARTAEKQTVGVVLAVTIWYPIMDGCWGYIRVVLWGLWSLVFYSTQFRVLVCPDCPVDFRSDIFVNF